VTAAEFLATVAVSQEGLYRRAALNGFELVVPTFGGPMSKFVGLSGSVVLLLGLIGWTVELAPPAEQPVLASGID